MCLSFTLLRLATGRLHGKMGHCPRNSQLSDQFYPISRDKFRCLELSFCPNKLILTSKAS